MCLELILDFFMKSSFMKDNGIFPMEVHIGKWWRLVLQNAKAKGTISSSTIKLVGWKVLKRPGVIFFLTRETRKEDMYFDTTLKTQAFVSWKRFLNLATRTHQGNFVMKIVRFKRKGNNRESRAFLKKYHSFYKRKNWCKAEIITGDIFGKPTFQVLWGL